MGLIRGELVLASFLFPGEACGWRSAILSVRENPKCPDEAVAESTVNEVWESCFNDMRPFYEPSISAAWIRGRELIKSVPDLARLWAVDFPCMERAIKFKRSNQRSILWWWWQRRSSSFPIYSSVLMLEVGSRMEWKIRERSCGPAGAQLWSAQYFDR